MSLFPDYCHAVADGQYHFFHSFVAGDQIVERKNAFGLRVMSFAVDDFAVPQRVVGQYISARTHTRQHKFVVVTVVALVGVNKHHVPAVAERRDDVERVADMKSDPVAYRSRREKLEQFVFRFVVDLDCVQLAAVGDALGYAECRIARKRSEFKHFRRSDHL